MAFVVNANLKVSIYSSLPPSPFPFSLPMTALNRSLIPARITEAQSCHPSGFRSSLSGVLISSPLEFLSLFSLLWRIPSLPSMCAHNEPWGNCCIVFYVLAYSPRRCFCHQLFIHVYTCMSMHVDSIFFHFSIGHVHIGSRSSNFQGLVLLRRSRCGFRAIVKIVEIARFPDDSGLLFNHVWGKTLHDGSQYIFGMRRHPNPTWCAVA